jgi:hypothetical protein
LHELFFTHEREHIDAWAEVAVLPGDDEIPRPANLDELIEIAEQLSGDTDFVRVDFLVSG